MRNVPFSRRLTVRVNSQAAIAHRDLILRRTKGPSRRIIQRPLEPPRPSRRCFASLRMRLGVCASRLRWLNPLPVLCYGMAYALSSASARRSSHRALQTLPRRYSPRRRLRGDGPLRQSGRDAGPQGARKPRASVARPTTRSASLPIIGNWWRSRRAAARSSSSASTPPGPTRWSPRPCARTGSRRSSATTASGRR